MAICTFPLYSIQAWGRFYGRFEGDAPHPPNVHNPDMCIYQRRMGADGEITIKEKYYITSNPRTPAQQSRRNLFADGVSRWQGMGAAEKSIFEIYGKPFVLPGYQRFLSLYLRGRA